MELRDLQQLVDADPRPTVVLDRQEVLESPIFKPLHCNAAFKHSLYLLQVLTSRESDHEAWRQWATSKTGALYLYDGPAQSDWLQYDVLDRWRVVQSIASQRGDAAGTIAATVPPPYDEVPEPVVAPKDVPAATGVALAKELFDLTDQAIEHVTGLAEHLQLIANFDWTTTTLGPFSSWSEDLLQLVHLLLLDPVPQVLLLGDQHNLIYNVAYGTLSGERHPQIMGQTIYSAWSEAVEMNVGMFNHIDKTGAPFIMDKFNISLDRNGYMEELYMNWTTISLRGPQRGYICYASDETSSELRERRKAFLTRLSETCRGKRGMAPFWSALLETIGTNDKDFPCAVIYSRIPGEDMVFKLEGALDTQPDDGLLPTLVDINKLECPFTTALKASRMLGLPTKITAADGTLPSTLSDLSERRGHGDRCTEGLVLPIRKISDDSDMLAFIVVGTHTRKTFSKDDEAFARYMLRSMSDLATNTLNAEEADRLASIAASKQETLIQALATSTTEASHLSMKFQRLLKTMEVIEVGIFEFDLEGNLVQANDAYFNLTGHPRGPNTAPWSWRNCVFEADLDKSHEVWDRAAAGNQVRWETRVRYHPKSDSAEEARKAAEGRWIDILAVPIEDATGKLTTISGCMIDVGEAKRHETDAIRREQEALEAKRNQEQSIDAISHELRNPLGAVIHCADSVLASLVDLETLVKDPDASLTEEARKQFLEFYDSTFDAVNTIISCSTHQRRIVDDVLTWSKLNSNLLQITPSLTRAASLLRDLRNMFEIDAQKNDVTLIIQQDAESPGVTSADWLMLDQGRLMQVLINLITNSIKFTRLEETRCVTVTMGTTTSRPSLDRLPIDFVPSPDPCKEGPCMATPEWGSGECVFVYFLVEDTGCGLTPEESSKLFSRFAQGSPRTHTKYGGSGLGLYISRELVKMQCGEIGFSSQAGVGSKFGFFTKARVAEAPRKASLPTTPAMRCSRMGSNGSAINTRFSILVVEDNIVNQAVLSKQLRKLGHDVHVASHGLEALQFIKASPSWCLERTASTNGGSQAIDTPMNGLFPEIDGAMMVPPSSLAADPKRRKSSTVAPSSLMVSPHGVELDVILMDVEMPVMDGLSCARELRRLQGEGRLDRHIPIIAVSANARSEQVQLAIDCGMDDAICKPFRIVDLMPKIERLVL